jgi:hypothetical protein
MGHSFNYFELEKGFVWPGNSLLLKNRMSLSAKKRLVGVLCVMAAVSFVVAGIRVITGPSGDHRAVMVAVIASTVLFIAFWDGSRKKVPTQGGIAILINLLILVYTLI